MPRSRAKSGTRLIVANSVVPIANPPTDSARWVRPTWRTAALGRSIVVEASIAPSWPCCTAASTAKGGIGVMRDAGGSRIAARWLLIAKEERFDGHQHPDRRRAHRARARRPADQRQ